tara:strand:- start:390 stop:1583 length:1194 start_codon:yes stop_codon:yes gene_type:complete
MSRSYHNLKLGIISFPLVIIFLFTSGCYNRQIFHLYDLPKPSGSHSIGTIQFDWVHTNFVNLFDPEPEKKRRIMVQFWYPGQINEKLEPFLYSNDSIVVKALSEEYNISLKLLKKSEKIKTNSYYDLVPEVNEDQYPLIIFSHGKGGYAKQNTVQFEELVSNGYIVASIDHSYDALITLFSDGSTAPYVSDNPKKVGGKINADKITNDKLISRVADVKYLLDKVWFDTDYHPIFRMIDTARVGMFGHSFGVATTILSVQEDNRIKAIAGLDGWFEPIAIEKLNKGVHVPFLHLGQKEWRFNPMNYKKMDILSKNSLAPIDHYPIKRVQHFDFMDGSQLASTSIKLLVPHLSTTNKYHIKTIINRMLFTFFNTELKRISTPNTKEVANQFKMISQSSK